MSQHRRLSVVSALAATAALLLAVPVPAVAHGDRERMERFQETYAASAAVPLIASGNVTHVQQHPGQVGISGCFMRTKPLLVTSGLDSVKVWDVADPAAPVELGTLVSAQFENEAMNCAERRTDNGIRRFALIGVDLYQAAPNQDDIQHANIGDSELVVVEVTDPRKPRILSRVPGTTSTHTVACIDERDCTFAYSAGDRSTKSFSIFDLRKPGQPREVDSDPDKAGVQAFTSPTAGHKWNIDNAGFASHTGWDGTAIFDVSRPRNPELVTTTGLAGKGDDPEYAGYNDFIHHNSFRPNANKFEKFATPSLDNGNVLLVTEEDYEQTDCAKAGSFQTWKVETLGGRKSAIVPLDKVELADLSTFPVPQYAFCSAHWFDFHQSGIVAAGFYGGGVQLLDVRNPRKITSFGHASWGASEVWDAYWVPKYDSSGNQTKRKTNFLYTVDLVRGLDVYNVALPGGERIAAPAQLGAGNVVAALSWSDEGVPVALVLSAFLGAVALRRRVGNRG